LQGDWARSEQSAISFKRHRFPAEVVRYAVWLYFRFTLGIRDVEELLAQRGIEVSWDYGDKSPECGLPQRPLEPNPAVTFPTP
jgi:hypothetical protein